MALKVENFPNIKNDISNALTYFGLGYEVNNDLLVITCGHEKCDAGKARQGPNVLGYFVLHYVVGGQGTFIINNKEFKISKNQSFVIFPNVPISYQQDRDNPWEYYWVSFSGLNANNYLDRCTFSLENPVLQIDSAEVIFAFKALSDFKKISASKDLKALSIIFDIFSTIIEEKSKNCVDNNYHIKSYVAKALSFIEINYTNEDLSLIQVSKALSITPNYLSRMFKSIIKMPFSKYLILFRLQKASMMIKDTDMFFKNISFSVGYSDSLYFSRMFKKYIGMTPKEYQNNFRKK